MRFPQSTDVTQLSNNYSQADQALRTDIMREIYEGVAAGDRTTDSITWTSVSEGDILTIIGELRQAGYGVTEGSGAITITWA